MLLFRRYTEYGKTMPKSLAIIGPVVFLLATYYFIRIFTYFREAFDYFNAVNTYWYLAYMLAMFVIYLNFLLTIFWLSSGNRRAWARLIRLSIIFEIAVAINDLGLKSMYADDLAFTAIIIAVGLVGVMLFMMTKKVRDFYTPIYGRPLPLKDWLLYIVMVDPYHSNTMFVE